MILAVTGHRPERLVIGQRDAYQPDVSLALRQFALQELRKFQGHGNGVELVITGMSIGWDQAVAEAAFDLKVPFAAYVPFSGQADVWNSESRDRYDRLLDRASSIVACSEGPYGSWKFVRRNNMMVDHADHLLALYDGSGRGRTAQCVAYANQRLKPVTNVWDSWEAFAVEADKKELVGISKERPMVDSKPRLGQISTEELGRRDAIHVPAVLVCSMATVNAGANVRFVDHQTVMPTATKAQAVADPWLNRVVNPGEQFWVLVNPDLVDQVTHQFEIKGVPVKEEDEEEETGADNFEHEDECRNCY